MGVFFTQFLPIVSETNVSLTLSIPSSQCKFSYHSRRKWLRDVVRNDCSINFHLSKLSNAKFSILYVISLVRDWQRKFLGSERVKYYNQLSVHIFFSSRSCIKKLKQIKKFLKRAICWEVLLSQLFCLLVGCGFVVLLNYGFVNSSTPLPPQLILPRPNEWRHVSRGADCGIFNRAGLITTSSSAMSSQLHQEALRRQKVIDKRHAKVDTASLVCVSQRSTINFVLNFSLRTPLSCCIKPKQRLEGHCLRKVFVPWILVFVGKGAREF